MFEKSDRDLFLDRTKKAREERAFEKQRLQFIIKIQAIFRSKSVRKQFISRTLQKFDQLLDSADYHDLESHNIFDIVQSFLFVWRKNRDQDRFLNLVRYLLESFNNLSVACNYCCLFNDRKFRSKWVFSLEKISKIACTYLNELKPEIQGDMKAISYHLNLLISLMIIHQNSTLINSLPDDSNSLSDLELLSQNLIKFLVLEANMYQSLKSLLTTGLVRCVPSLKTLPLSAIIVLVLRPLNDNLKSTTFPYFLTTILTVPALIEYIHVIAPDKLQLFLNGCDLLQLLETIQANMMDICNQFDADLTLLFLANVIHLASLQNRDFFDDSRSRNALINTLQSLLLLLRTFLVSKSTNLSYWNPILGWCTRKNQYDDNSFSDALSLVRNQLCLLWQSPLLTYLLDGPLEKISNTGISIEEIYSSVKTTAKKSIIQKAMRNIGLLAWDASKEKLATCIYRSFEDDQIVAVFNCGSFYHNVLQTFVQLKMDILTGLCYRSNAVYHIWLLLISLGPLCAYKSFADKFIINNCSVDSKPELKTLHLFIDCVTHFITLLDDIEMYEIEAVFKISDFIYLSKFINHLSYELLTIGENKFEKSVHNLLMVLYRKDCRRRYTISEDNWTIKQLKISTFLTDYLKNKKYAKQIIEKVPHIIPLDERIRLLRKFIADEKLKCGYIGGISSTLIKVHRNRILEDGFRQISSLTPSSLRGVIRVGFINEQGLDEAGIDQDGVFKEFMEETVKKVFNPELNLFRVSKSSSEQRLFPSATSYFQEDHLKLFEFVGKLIGKSIYEGFVVDVPFATFFLSQVLGQTQQLSYSAIDELPSLDPELYRNLMFIKNSKDDVAELELTFSVNDDLMGEIVTYELLPGGKSISVTNENKINYIHLMAHFRMHTQIKDQTAAFLKGFRSIISMEWLQMFSTRELQKLIAGDNAPLDFKDLRKHTQYFGGFHDSHKVIIWLWDILIREFTEMEKASFLKFVTSCSKAPILGFAYLEPPFAIRCVEVSEDEDIGDTLDSVIRGLFTIRRPQSLDRLPTSATCFNLLKLPNYNKKHILREKLRYAVMCNTGFELS